MYVIICFIKIIFMHNIYYFIDFFFGKKKNIYIYLKAVLYKIYDFFFNYDYLTYIIFTLFFFLIKVECFNIRSDPQNLSFFMIILEKSSRATIVNAYKCIIKKKVISSLNFQLPLRRLVPPKHVPPKHISMRERGLCSNSCRI